MISRFRYIPILLVLLFACQAMGQEDEALPKVLIIGDSIYSNPARSVSDQLKGQALVEYADYRPNPVLNSSTAIEMLDQLLGRADANGKPIPEERWPTWDLIHLNVGLGDLVHRVPDMEDFRLLPIHAGGVVATGPAQYEKNLDTLINRIKEKTPNTRIIWASTTPIRASRSNVFELGSEIKYNQIADQVMKKHDVPINDMYNYVKELIDMDKPASHGSDPFSFDKKPIHDPIVASIADNLGLRVETKK